MIEEFIAKCFACVVLWGVILLVVAQMVHAIF